MLGKLLKRKISRANFDPVTPDKEQPAQQNGQQQKQIQYSYKRPDILGSYTEDDFTKFANHVNRPIVSPKVPIFDYLGYAEVMNAGKSKYNEDQTVIVEGTVGEKIPYLYIGVFDGHGGPGAAVKVSRELHQLIAEGLEDISYRLEDTEDTLVSDISDDEDEDDADVEVKMTKDELIAGTLESSFWAMDRLIFRDKSSYRISGGCTALVALFILDKLYVANAGDSRACCFFPEEPVLKEMSFDFTPMNDRQRIQLIAFQRPELLRHPQTDERVFNRHVLSKSLHKRDVGGSIMYKDFYMTGWSCRDVCPDDVGLTPMIAGKGKQCRLMGTVGVARAIGDHDLVVRGTQMHIKDFLTPQPEVRILDLSQRALKGNEFLIMGTDGLWDVLSNESVHATLGRSGKSPNPQSLAEELVRQAKGHRVPDGWWEMDNGDLASGDDISTVVVELKSANRSAKVEE